MKLLAYEVTVTFIVLPLTSVVTSIIIIIIDNHGLNARWCLTPLLLSLPTAAYLGQRGVHKQMLIL